MYTIYAVAELLVSSCSSRNGNTHGLIIIIIVIV